MNPNTFLKTFWRLELKPQVFVAMSFASEHQTRYKNIIEPAIRTLQVDGITLEPFRVDLSKSGDSILTEINDGIAHSRLILADVSTMGKDASTGKTYRNGNVMYEVGIALACRQPHEILLIRDDYDKFLFDVSTIPHKHIDFTDENNARAELQEELLNRLKQANYVNDARVQIAIANLTAGEINVLKYISRLTPGHGIKNDNDGNVAGLVSIPRLLDKQLIFFAGSVETGHAGYLPTPLGKVVAEIIERNSVK